MTQKEDFYDKMKRVAEKTEAFIENQVDKLKKSGAIDKANEYADKTSEYIEKKAKQSKESDIPDKVDAWVEKTEEKAREVIKKVDDFMGDLQKKKSASKYNQEENSEDRQQKME